MGRARAEYNAFTPAEERRIVACYTQADMPITAIARRYKREDNTIKEILVRHGCKINADAARRRA